MRSDSSGLRRAPVVYTAEPRSLASLEVLVHTEDTRVLATVQWVTIPVDIDERLIEIARHLPEDWRELPAPPSTRDFASRWVMQARSPVLRVPSIVVDGEFNHILNPRHADFGRLKIGASAPLSFDPRLDAPFEHGKLASIRSRKRLSPTLLTNWPVPPLSTTLSSQMASSEAVIQGAGKRPVASLRVI
jgi:RES domain-containing protein